MHYWPFMEELDEPAWDLTSADQYDNWYFFIDPPHRQRLWQLLQAAGVDILFCGHVHTGRPVQVVDASAYVAPNPPAHGSTRRALARSGHALRLPRCEVTDAGIGITFIPDDDQCAEFDSYGPMGHPPVGVRDYSAARESPALIPDAHD